MKEYQDNPNCVQVELTEGCPLRCVFCGVNHITRPGDYRFMTIETAKVLAIQIARMNWNSRIEFAMHGEPTLNPNILEIIRIFRTELPFNQLMLTTNGAGLVKDAVLQIKRLFFAGLNILALDNYATSNMGQRIIDQLMIGDCDLPFVFYPQDGLEWSPHKRRSPSTQLVIIVQDIVQASKGNHARLSNHAGSGAPVSTRMHGKRCAQPFREVSVQWDGTVAPCCNMWRNQVVAGNIHTQSLGAIWNGDVFRAVRRFLYRGERQNVPGCKDCDYISNRVGLLPDKLGKETLPLPTQDDKLIIEEAAKTPKPTYPREWEEK